MTATPKCDPASVNQISEVLFADGWARVTGYRPATVLTDRREMIAMLVEDAAVLPVFPQRTTRRGYADSR